MAKTKKVFKRSNGKIFTVYAESAMNYRFTKSGRCNMDKSMYIELTDRTAAMQARLRELSEPIEKVQKKIDALMDKACELDDVRAMNIDAGFCYECHGEKDDADRTYCDDCMGRSPLLRKQSDRTYRI